MASLEGVLAAIPGYGGYLAQRQQNEQAGMQDLQQFGAVQGVLANLAAQQQKQAELRRQEQFRAELQANPEKAREIAAKYASPDQLIKMQEGQAIGAGGLRLPDGTIVAPVARPVPERPTAIGAGGLRLPDGTIVPPVVKPTTEKWSEPYQLNGVTVQKNEATGQIRTAVTREPRITVTQPRQPIVKTDEQGNTKLYDYEGNLIRDLGKTSAPSAQFQKTEAARRQTVMDLDRAISELGQAVREGGLIDKSTGSGAGALVDTAAGFFGKATPGSIAVGQLKPIYDLVLKMVPRFEGPQSDKDTKTYQDAAGQLANPNIPNAQKKAAGREILRLMVQRKGQFISKDAIGAEVGPSSGNILDQADAILRGQ